MSDLFLIQQVATELQGQGYDTSVSEVNKSNQRKTALTVYLPGMNTSPAIYPEILADMYEPGMSISQLADKVLSFVRRHQSPFPNWLNNKDYILSNCVLAICRDEYKELKDNVVYERVGNTDLCIYPIIKWNNLFTTVTKDFLEYADLSIDLIMLSARENSRKTYSMISADDYIASLFGKRNPLEKPMMFIFGSPDSRGAAAISDKATLNKAMDMLNTDAVYILPSSVHDIIITPVSKSSLEELIETVGQVNESVVKKADFLSNHVYYYDGDKVTVVSL